MAKVLDQIKAKMSPSHNSSDENEFEGFMVSDHEQWSTFKKQTVCSLRSLIACSILTNSTVQGKELSRQRCRYQDRVLRRLWLRCPHHHWRLGRSQSPTVRWPRGYWHCYQGRQELQYRRKSWRSCWCWSSNLVMSQMRDVQDG
jgi:hypothetical protein